MSLHRDPFDVIDCDASLSDSNGEADSAVDQ